MDGRFIATLALKCPWHLTLDELVSSLQEKIPPLRQDVSGCKYGGEKALAQEAYIISISGRHYAVAYVPEPAPAARFTTATAYAVERWPDAAETLSDHGAHVIVSNLETAGGFHAAIDAAGSVTLIAGVLAELGPSLGVHWSAGEVLHTPTLFAALTDTLIAGDPPVDAWITIRAHLDDYAPDAKPRIGVSTLGLNPFCGREVEIETAPVSTTQACDRVMAVAADILRHGPDLDDNSTIRIGDKDVIQVNLAEKGRFSPQQPVISLTVIEIAPHSPEPAPELVPGTAPLFNRRRRNKPFAT